MDKVAIRPANKQDAADLAILDNLAGHGIPMQFWTDQTANGRTEEGMALGRTLIADDSQFYNWKKARVACDEDGVLGMSVSYIMPKLDEESDAIESNFEAFGPVCELYALAENDWFIDALAIYPEAQQKGIGKLLFEDSIAMGKDAEASNISLVVEDTNEVAYTLYRSYGFEVTDQRKFIPFEGCLEINEWLLMTRVLHEQDFETTSSLRA